MNGKKTNDEDTSATSFNGERTRTEAAKAFSVPERKVRTAAQLDKADKGLACHTQEEIAARLEIPQQTVAGWTKVFTEIGNLAKSGKSAAEHATDFDPPIGISQVEFRYRSFPAS